MTTPALPSAHTWAEVREVASIVGEAGRDLLGMARARMMRLVGDDDERMVDCGGDDA